jgi:hypothetical protein
VAVVRTLLDEIEVAIDQLDGATGVHREVMDAEERWERVSTSTPLDSIADLVRMLQSHRTPDLTLSSVDALLASGRLGLIGDDEMRRWIAAWPGIKEDFDEETQGVIQFARFVVPAYFVSSGIPRTAADGTPSAPRGELRRLLDNTAFDNLYYQAWEVSEVFVREGALVRGALERGAELARAMLRGAQQ